MERQIARNNFKVTLLVGASVLMFIIFGGLIVWAFESWMGLLVPIAGIAYLIFGYSRSTKAIVKMTGALPVTRKSHRQLYNIADNLSITAGIKTPQVYIIDDSSLNAFAAGSTIEKSIIGVTQGLLDHLDRQELEGVIAHEISHIINRDVRLSVFIFVLIGSMALMLDVFYFSGAGGRRRGGGGYAILIVLVAGFLFRFLAILAKYAVSRQREYLADVSGAQLTRHPRGLASALEKIRLHGSNLRQPKKEVAHLFLSNPFKKQASGALRTHPRLEDRINRLHEMERAGY